MNRTIPIYKKGSVLGRCVVCGALNYIEQHGTTGPCKCRNYRTEHENIPYDLRDPSGCWYTGERKKPQN